MFWESKTALFGHPNARGWINWHPNNERSDCQTLNSSSKPVLDSAIDELEEDWGHSSVTQQSRWNNIATAWNSTIYYFKLTPT